MTASILQLVCVGNEDYYIIGNPQISYFKSVYKRHSLFSIERRRIYNKGSRQLNDNNLNKFIYEIDTSYGDFLDKVYFQIKLPEIKSQYPYKFKWIKNLGEMLIEEANIYINNQLIESLDSDSIYLLNRYRLNNKNTNNYDEMICNTHEYNNPDKNGYTFNSIIEDDVVNNDYSDIPSISEANIYVKIPFFFVRDKILKFPLLKTRNSKIIIEIIVKPLDSLYTISVIEKINLGKRSIHYTQLDDKSYTELSYYKEYIKKDILPISIYDMTSINSFNNLDMSLYYHVYFCDNYEKNYYINNNLDILINICKLQMYTGLTNYNNLKIENRDIVKELIFIPKRDDNYMRNTWSNYTNSDTKNDSFNISYYNNYLNISYLQMQSDNLFIKNINLTYQNYINKLSDNSVIYIDILYTVGNEINTINFTGNTINDPLYKKYIDTLNTIPHHKISPFTYYGLFSNYSTADLIVTKDIFKLKLINNNHLEFTDEVFKYLPTVTLKTSNYKNDTINIDYTKPVYTDSILNNNIVLKPEYLIDLMEIRDLLEKWKFRDVQNIPYIDHSNIDFYVNNNIINRLDLKINGNYITNQLNVNYIKGIELSHYDNHIDNIIRIPFSVSPLEYKPTGHLNLEDVENLEFYIELKNVLDKETILKKYKYNLHVYLICIKILHIKNDKIDIS